MTSRTAMGRRGSSGMAILALGLGLAVSSLAAAARAEETTPATQDRRLTLWDLHLGQRAAALPSAAFIDFACGTNGGPPGRRIDGFAAFAACPAEPSGLHEVTFRYDDEDEYIGRAHRSAAAAEQGGTTLYDFPVIVSGLFSESGVLSGVRVVTDARTDINTRKQEYTLANFLAARYADGLSCVDLPPDDGETPVGSEFIKRRCVGERDAMALLIESRFYRRPGQVGFNPNSGTLTRAQWESSARFEMLLRR